MYNDISRGANSNAVQCWQKVGTSRWPIPILACVDILRSPGCVSLSLAPSTIH